MIPARCWSPSVAHTAAPGTFTGLSAPVQLGRDGTFGHRAAHCGAAAGYWVTDPNGRVGVILRRQAKQAQLIPPPRRASEPATFWESR